MTGTRLPRATWLLIAGDAVSARGTGLVLPLALIYLHQARGIPLPARLGRRLGHHQDRLGQAPRPAGEPALT
jgi:hypothetical protein